MDLRGLFNKYESILVQMAADRQNAAFQIATQMFALVASRVQNDGIDADGNSFKAYTAAYAAKRKSFGLPIDKRYHTFTGDMFKKTRPEVVEHNYERTVVEIKASDRENQEKINENSRIVGINIIKLSQEENNLLEELNLERIQKYFK